MNRQKTTTIAADHHRPSLKTLPFPAEIRNQIYAYVFAPSYKLHWRPYPEITSPTLNILSTSKTIYQEALPILYTAERRFRFSLLDNQGFPHRVDDAKAQAPRSCVLDSHAFRMSGPPMAVEAIALRRLMETFAAGPYPRTLQVNTNFHGIRRLADNHVINLLARFEIIDLCLAAEKCGVVKGAFYPSFPWKSMRAATDKRVEVLMGKLESKFGIGTVHVERREERWLDCGTYLTSLIDLHIRRRELAS